MMTKADAVRYRKAMVEGAASLTDEEALQVPMLFDRWTAGRQYALGTRLYYDGNLYTVLQDHTSHEAYLPDATVSLYARVLIPDPEQIPDWEQPLSTNPYMMGDKVRHNGHVWVSTIDYNVFEPGVAGWDIVE